jgi:hypothetical protein
MNTRCEKFTLIKFGNINLFSPVLPPSLHPLIAGGVSAFITTTLYQPLDFLKTQIQEPKDG